MTDKELIKQGIEKRIESINSCPFRNSELGSEKFSEGELCAYNQILQFIDSLPKESGCEVNCTTKSEDLEESARYYLLHTHISPLNDILHQADLKAEMQYHKDIENAFKAGAEWHKTQMMEDAVKGEVRKGYVGNQIVISSKDGSSKYVAFDASYSNAFYIGDRVKIIIVKEEQ